MEMAYEEYSQPQNIAKYQRATAGQGIEYNLHALYGPLLMEHARASAAATGSASLRILEFGCGAGMVLAHLAEELRRAGYEIDAAVGTDLVPEMITAARAELAAYGSPWAVQHLRFIVAPNEALYSPIAEDLEGDPRQVEQGFDFVCGVNTLRYNVLGGSGEAVARELAKLMAPGARVVMIDMNDRFPYGLKPKRSGPSGISFAREILPTLQDYERPFDRPEFRIVERGHMNWIPHSANGLRFHLARLASAPLDKLVPDRAMRSVIVAERV